LKTAEPEINKGAKKQLEIINFLQTQKSFNSDVKKAEGFNQPAIKALEDKGIIEKNTIKLEAKPFAGTKQDPLSLNEEQHSIIEDFKNTHTEFYTGLIEGVTGSGKTEVYLQLIQEVLKNNQQVIVLVPEIGLTPQTVKRFRDRFHCETVMLHSNLTDKQRLDAWAKAKEGIAKIIIGTRSALFTATQNLGLIIIDEEHDLSYKQQDGLRYSAKDLSIVRAKMENIPIFLGSATPTLESLHNAEHGRFQHWQLTKRANNAQLPAISVNDIRKTQLIEGLSENSLLAIANTIEKKEQALIFINRRGFSHSLLCHDCGWVSQCHACDSRHTVHMQARHLRCHQCQQIEPIPQQCPQCLSNQLIYQGVGTERLEQSLKQHFPHTPLFRIDRDTTSTKTGMADMLENIHQSEDAILVGTQMLAKGHHFPNVTLAVILEADASLTSIDYRSLERFGQLLTQVIGRAGREGKSGQAIIQTHYPEHPQLAKLLNLDYHRFAMDLLSERQQLNLPPFSYQALIRLEDQNADQAFQSLENIRLNLRHLPCQIIGPYPAALQKRAYFYRYQLLLQTSNRAEMKQVIQFLLETSNRFIKPHKQRWSIDVDPQDMS
jgi:primosomal protein N' (replication factor Y)